MADFANKDEIAGTQVNAPAEEDNLDTDAARAGIVHSND